MFFLHKFPLKSLIHEIVFVAYRPVSFRFIYAVPRIKRDRCIFIVTLQKILLSSSIVKVTSLGSTFIVYVITRKILKRSALIFVGALGTLGQHKFAVWFYVSIWVEISRVRKKVGCGGLMLFEHSRSTSFREQINVDVPSKIY